MGFVSRGRPPVGEASCRSASAQMRAESALHELYETGSGDRSHLSRSLRQSADHRRLRRSQRLLNRVWLRPGATKSTAPSSPSRTWGEGLPSGRIQDKPALLRVRGAIRVGPRTRPSRPRLAREALFFLQEWSRRVSDKTWGSQRRRQHP